MKWRVVVTEPAHADAALARDWIALDSVQAANAWLDGLYAAASTLAYFPRRFRRAPEQKRFGGEVRQMLYHSHRIIYQINGPTVSILHIRHAARLPLGEME